MVPVTSSTSLSSCSRLATRSAGAIAEAPDGCQATTSTERRGRPAISKRPSSPVKAWRRGRQIDVAAGDHPDVGGRDRLAGAVGHDAGDHAAGAQHQLEAAARGLAVDDDGRRRGGGVAGIAGGEAVAAGGQRRQREAAVVAAEHAVAPRIDHRERLRRRGRGHPRVGHRPCRRHRRRGPTPRRRGRARPRPATGSRGLRPSTPSPPPARSPWRSPPAAPTSGPPRAAWRCRRRR